MKKKTEKTLHDFNFELSTRNGALIECVTIKAAASFSDALGQLPSYNAQHSKVRSSRFGDGLFHPLVTASRIEAGVLQREAAAAALDESIASWQARAKATNPHGIALGHTGCALCKLHNLGQGCDGCPVKQATGKNYCIGTPYTHAADTLRHWRACQCSELEASMLMFQDAAQSEVEFLQSLLPEGGAP